MVTYMVSFVSFFNKIVHDDHGGDSKIYIHINQPMHVKFDLLLVLLGISNFTTVGFLSFFFLIMWDFSFE